MQTTKIQHSTAFSLIELVIVVVIIGVIAAIAIPRLSRGAAGATDSALSGDLAVLRCAIDLYGAEHGAYPALATFEAQLTQYSDAAGGTSDSKTSTHIYGPYLRKVPALKVGLQKGYSGVTSSPGSSYGWVYDETSGGIKANTTTETDASGTLYSDY